jgi:hypothetical protein
LRRAPSRLADRVWARTGSTSWSLSWCCTSSQPR